MNIRIFKQNQLCTDKGVLWFNQIIIKYINLPDLVQMSAWE